ncbi:MAG: sugar nucleotide-binding protein, partial [Planctomycetaceae bacterium]|nr:sugar nucleotide-binding protein [Planctomycetaceae bacterium]
RTSPYREEDCPGPVSAYGVSKLAGEHLVRANCSQHFVIRTCGLYGRPTSPGKGNFVRTMLRLAQDREEVRVVDDQTCTPTSTADLAAAIRALVQTNRFGLYHITNSGATTWCGFARTIFALAGLQVRVIPITSAEFAAPARRPTYSVLDTTRLTEVTGQPLRPWTEALSDYMEQLNDPG